MANNENAQQKPGAALQAFKEGQKPSDSAPAATVVTDTSRQVRKVQVKALDTGSFRVGPTWYAMTKGKNVTLPEDVASYFKGLRKVE